MARIIKTNGWIKPKSKEEMAELRGRRKRKPPKRGLNEVITERL